MQAPTQSRSTVVSLKERRGRPKRKASDSAASNSPSSQPHKVRRTQNNVDRDGTPDSTRDERIRATREHIRSQNNLGIAFNALRMKSSLMTFALEGSIIADV